MSVEPEPRILLDSEKDDPDLARALINDLDLKPANAHERLAKAKCGQLYAFGKERQQLDIFRDLIAAYIAGGAPKRPLCLAVFGPPGSGKSFAVKEIVDTVPLPKSGFQLPLVEVNLTQV